MVQSPQHAIMESLLLVGIHGLSDPQIARSCLALLHRVERVAQTVAK